MSLWGNIASLWGTGQTEAELQAESDRLDAEKDRLDAAARQRLARDYGDEYADQWWTQVQENEVGDGSTYNQNVQSQVDDAFDDELDARTRALSGGVGDLFKPVGALLKGVLLGIPLWIWLIAAGVLFFSFGGSGIIRAFVRKKSA